MGCNEVSETLLLIRITITHIIIVLMRKMIALISILSLLSLIMFVINLNIKHIVVIIRIRLFIMEIALTCILSIAVILTIPQFMEFNHFA